MFIFNIMFAIVPVLVVCVFVFTFIMILSPKFRGKMMSRQIKATKYMIEESKEDLTDLVATTGDVTMNASKKILDENEDNIRDMITKGANISKVGIETTVRAIKKGLTEDVIYCKYCGASIDLDSKFCKHCGKKQ